MGFTPFTASQAASYTLVNIYSYNWTSWLVNSLLSKLPAILYYYCVVLCRPVSVGPYCEMKIQNC